MPIFNFVCVQCGTKMEVLQKFDDPDPVCGCGYQMIKELSTYNFHLKGEGWAKDGYSKPTTTNTDVKST
jgi:putative FmdB family regulatory protein